MQRSLSSMNQMRSLSHQPASALIVACGGTVLLLSLAVGADPPVTPSSEEIPPAEQPAEAKSDDVRVQEIRIGGVIGPGEFPLSPWPPEGWDTVERRALEKQMCDDTRRITIHQMTLFHRHVVQTFREHFPQKLRPKYHGQLAGPKEFGEDADVALLANWTPGLGLDPSETAPYALLWSADDPWPLFYFWISTAKTEQTAAVCDLEGTRLFVNIYFVSSGHSADEPLKKLGGRTVRETVKLLERKSAAKNGDG